MAGRDELGDHVPEFLLFLRGQWRVRVGCAGCGNVRGIRPGKWRGGLRLLHEGGGQHERAHGYHDHGRTVAGQTQGSGEKRFLFPGFFLHPGFAGGVIRSGGGHAGAPGHHVLAHGGVKGAGNLLTDMCPDVSCTGWTGRVCPACKGIQAARRALALQGEQQRR